MDMDIDHSVPETITTTSTTASTTATINHCGSIVNLIQLFVIGEKVVVAIIK